jgi:drug/metabolite transporter (DMT)-like permease
LKQTSQFILAGFIFSVLWASASIAGKFGLDYSEPLTLFTVRFLIAGGMLLLFAGISQDRLVPAGKEWWQLMVFGAFNTALYLGIFIIALQFVAAGITALAIALNPLLISVLTSFWMRRPIASREWLSIAVGMTGVVIASVPLLKNGYATLPGLALLTLSMVTYSIGAVFYATVKWQLSRIAINGWQVLFGGLLLLPFTIFFEGAGGSNYDLGFWLSIGWLIVPVSIVAVQLWLYLVKEDTVRASLWLFLCPIFGLLFSTWLLDEPFTLYTLAGALMVVVSLYLGQRTKSIKAG